MTIKDQKDSLPVTTRHFWDVAEQCLVAIRHKKVGQSRILWNSRLAFTVLVSASSRVSVHVWGELKKKR